jgi:hypothetical protein
MIMTGPDEGKRMNPTHATRHTEYANEIERRGKALMRELEEKIDGSINKPEHYGTW